MQQKCAPPAIDQASTDPTQDPTLNNIWQGDFAGRAIAAIANNMHLDAVAPEPAATLRFANAEFKNLVASMMNERIYKCYVGRNVYWSQKMLFYFISFTVQQLQKDLDERFGVQAILLKIEATRKIAAKIMAYALNQVCHQSEPYLTTIKMPDLQSLYDEYNASKLALLNFIPPILHTAIKLKFPDASSEVPSDSQKYYDDMEKILGVALNTIEKKAQWRTIFTDLKDTHQDLADVLIPGVPILLNKRDASIFYDRQHKFYEDLRKFYFTDLSLQDDEQFTVRKLILLSDCIAAMQVMGVHWGSYFIKPQQPVGRTKEEREIQNRFKTAQKYLYTFKSGGLFNQLVENFRLMENLVKDMDGIEGKAVEYDEYRHVFKDIQQKLCFPECEMCNTLLNTEEPPPSAGAASFLELQIKAKDRIKNKADFPGIQKFINQVYSCFFRQIAALRKHGPITDIIITRDNYSNGLLLYMGYQALRLTEHTSENTIWICRYCGGGMGVSNISTGPNHSDNNQPDPELYDDKFVSDLTRFEELEAPAQGIIVRMKVTETIHLNIKKSFIEAELDAAAEVDCLSFIFPDVSAQKYVNEDREIKHLADLDLYYTMNKWKPSLRQWSAEPSQLHKLTTLEDIKSPQCIVIVEQFSSIIRQQYKTEAKIVQRWENNELWIVDKATLLIIEQKISQLPPPTPPAATPAGPAREDIGVGNGIDIIPNPKQQILFKHVMKPFSYVTVLTEKDKEAFMAGGWSTARWEFKLTPLKFLKTRGQGPTDIPVWIGIRSMYAGAEPKNQDERSPPADGIKTLELAQISVATPVCTPGSPPNTFIEDSYLPPEGFEGSVDCVEALESEGDSGSNPACVPIKTALDITRTTIDSLTAKFAELLVQTPIPVTNQNILDAARAGCKFKLTYTIESPCESKFLYLARGNGGVIKEFCIEDITDPASLDILTGLPKESVIPIQRKYHAILSISNDDFSMPETIYKEFNIANWLRTRAQKAEGTGITTPFQVVIKFVVLIDLVDFHFIGLKDQLTDEGNCNNHIFGDATHAQFKNWKRFTPNDTTGLLDQDATLRFYQRTVMFAAEAKSIMEMQGYFGFGDVNTATWQTNLNRNRCRKARVFIPINWSGGGNPACAMTVGSGSSLIELPVVKSVTISQREGIKEQCDGSMMAIKDTYYVEIVIMEQVDNAYAAPPDADIRLAKKHGYYLQDMNAFEYAGNGFNTKVRLWIKPDTTGYHTRNLICRGTPFKEGIKFKVEYE